MVEPIIVQNERREYLLGHYLQFQLEMFPIRSLEAGRQVYSLSKALPPTHVIISRGLALLRIYWQLPIANIFRQAVGVSDYHARI